MHLIFYVLALLLILGLSIYGLFRGIFCPAGNVICRKKDASNTYLEEYVITNPQMQDVIGSKIKATLTPNPNGTFTLVWQTWKKDGTPDKPIPFTNNKWEFDERTCTITITEQDSDMVGYLGKYHIDLNPFVKFNPDKTITLRAVYDKILPIVLTVKPSTS